MKGIIYCRVSSHEQVQGTSLENQQRACLEYAGQKGISVLQTFVEKGESATAANRTELIKALAFCSKNRVAVDAFIVWKIDRFARNTTDHYALRAQLGKYGISLHSVTEPISDDPIGQMTEAMLAGYAQFENDIRKQRCEGGMQRRIAEGIWPWHPPLGYINSKKRADKRKTVPDEPDPERFYLLQKAFQLYSAGNHTSRALTDAMNRWGLRTRSGQPLYPQVIDRLLRDKFYAGVLVDPWTGTEYQGQHQPLITLEEYHKIQIVKKRYSRVTDIPHLSAHPDFPLRRFVSCVCSGRLTGSWRKGKAKKYPYYCCYEAGCRHNTHGIPKLTLEETFVGLLDEVRPGDQFVRAFERAINDTWHNRVQVATKSRAQYDAEVKRIEDRKRELEIMRMNREISAERFVELRDDQDRRETALRLAMTEVPITEGELQPIVASATNVLRNLGAIWQRLERPEYRQRLQRLMFPEGLVYDKAANTFGTPLLSLILSLSRDFTGHESHLVAAIGENWHTVVTSLREAHDFVQEDPAIELAILEITKAAA